MSSNIKLAKFIEESCKENSLQVENFGDDSFKIFTDEASGITLFLEIKEPTGFSFYFLQRTHDIIYQGDRSDAHVVLSLMFASFLRSLDSGVSCSLFDIPHPAVEDEIWGRYIMRSKCHRF